MTFFFDHPPRIPRGSPADPPPIPPGGPKCETVVKLRPPPILLEHDRLLFKASGWNSQKEYQKGPFHAVWPNLIVDRMTARRGLLEVTVLGDHIIADVEVLGCCSHH